MTSVSLTSTPAGATATVLSAASGSCDASAPSGAADFLAAILQALAPLTGEAAADPAGAQGGSAPEAGDETADTTGVDPTALGLVAILGVGPTTAPVPVAASPAGAGTTDLVAERANVAPGADAAPMLPSSDIRMSGGATGGTGTTPTHATPAADSTTAPAEAGAQGQGSTPVADETHTDAAEPAARTAADPSNTPGPAPQAAPQPSSLTPAGPALTTPAQTAATPAPAATAHVTRQVFPEVTSLVTRGDGTHRITLALKPEALGEVRVVMTVRDGVVHVRLAAGHDAQRALLEGSPELTRLLEAAGAGETRVVVRDLGTTPSTTSTGAAPDLSQGLGDSRPQDQHAGTRAQHPATDGTNDPRSTRGTTGANPPRSVEPVTRTRTAGVDVTM
jgi:flagellar hook-length control protein FliK